MIRAIKIASTLCRLRIASIMRLARIIIAEIPERQFDEMVNNFLAGLKSAVKNNQLKDAQKRLDIALAKDIQSRKLHQDDADDFRESTKKNLPYLRNKEGIPEQKQWKKLGVSEKAIRAADDYVSWTKFTNGDYDETMKKQTKVEIQKNFAPELYSDVGLLEEVFDKIIMSFVNYTEALQKLNNARMIVRPFGEKFVRFPAYEIFDKVSRRHEHKKLMTKEKEEYIEDPFQEVNDKQVVKEFVKFARNKLESGQGGVSTQWGDATETVIKKMLEDGEQKLKASAFFREYEEELRLLGIKNQDQMRRLIKIIKGYAKEFVDQEVPGMSRAVSREVSD